MNIEEFYRVPRELWDFLVETCGSFRSIFLGWKVVVGKIKLGGGGDGRSV